MPAKLRGKGQLLQSTAFDAGTSSIRPSRSHLQLDFVTNRTRLIKIPAKPSIKQNLECSVDDSRDMRTREHVHSAIFSADDKAFRMQSLMMPPIIDRVRRPATSAFLRRVDAAHGGPVTTPGVTRMTIKPGKAPTLEEADPRVLNARALERLNEVERATRDDIAYFEQHNAITDVFPFHLSKGQLAWKLMRLGAHLPEGPDGPTRDLGQFTKDELVGLYQEYRRRQEKLLNFIRAWRKSKVHAAFNTLCEFLELDRTEHTALFDTPRIFIHHHEVKKKPEESTSLPPSAPAVESSKSKRATGSEGNGGSTRKHGAPHKDEDATGDALESEEGETTTFQDFKMTPRSCRKMNSYFASFGKTSSRDALGETW